MEPRQEARRAEALGEHKIHVEKRSRGDAGGARTRGPVARAGTGAACERARSPRLVSNSTTGVNGVHGGGRQRGLLLVRIGNRIPNLGRVPN